MRFKIKDKFILFLCLLLSSISQSADKDYMTFENKPLGTIESPMIIRNYLPNPDLDKDTVLPNHSTGLPSPFYSHGTGKETAGRNYKTMNGIPGGIAVNYGKGLSVCWDTTECRLLYAWNNGFIDMTPIWGDKKSGRRQKNNYVPKLYGTLFFKAMGKHPIYINGKSVADSEFRYEGFDIKNKYPIFKFIANNSLISVAIKPGKTAQTVHMKITSNKKSEISFQTQSSFETVSKQLGSLEIIISPNAAEEHKAFKEKVIKIDKPTAKIGEELYTLKGCLACHTTDGGKGHGPSLKGIFGQSRKIQESPTVITVDKAYILESIKAPQVKTVVGYQKGMMPPYALTDAEYESIILFIQSLK